MLQVLFWDLQSTRNGDRTYLQSNQFVYTCQKNLPKLRFNKLPNLSQIKMIPLALHLEKFRFHKMNFR